MKYYESFREQTNCYTVEGVLDYFNKRIRVDHYTGNVESIIQRASFFSKPFKGKLPSHANAIMCISHTRVFSSVAKM